MASIRSLMYQYLTRPRTTKGSPATSGWPAWPSSVLLMSPDAAGRGTVLARDYSRSTARARDRQCSRRRSPRRQCPVASVPMRSTTQQFQVNKRYISAANMVATAGMSEATMILVSCRHRRCQ
jgi:hypothetical protein